MNKVLYIILISLFSLTIISCAKKDDSLSSSSSGDSLGDSGSTDNSDSGSGSSATLKISSFIITSRTGTIIGSALSQSSNSALSGVSVSYAQSGTTILDTTNDSSGNFIQTLIFGVLYIKDLSKKA